MILRDCRQNLPRYQDVRRVTVYRQRFIGAMHHTGDPGRQSNLRSRPADSDGATKSEGNQWQTGTAPD